MGKDSSLFTKAQEPELEILIIILEKAEWASRPKYWRATDKAIQSPSLATMCIHMTTYTSTCVHVHVYTHYYVLVAVDVVTDAVECHLPLKVILCKITKSTCVYSCPFYISQH